MIITKTAVMKHLSIILTVSWLSCVVKGQVDSRHSPLLIKTNDNAAEVYNDNDNGRNWLHMLLVFARDSSNSQSTSLTGDKTSIKRPDIGCDDGFTRLESGKCYWFSNQRKERSDALAVCQNMGTTLAHPINARENTALVNYLKSNYNGTRSGWYLGGTDEANEGQWIWGHNKAPLIYTDWLKGQPDDYNGIEDCVHIWEDNGWQWNDVPCNRSLTFICQH